MALGFNSSPVNFGIDYNQNKVGDYYGNALSNTGGMLGNAIMQYGKTAADKKKKDEREQYAIDFLKQQGLPEEQAKATVKGIGIDDFLKFQQIDQQTKALGQRAQMAEAKAQQAQAQNNAIMQAVAAASKQQMPQSGPMSVLPSGGASGQLQNPDGGMDANVFMRSAAQNGVPSERINQIVASINSTNKANKPEKPPFLPSAGQLPSGRGYVTTSPNSVQFDPLKKDEKPGRTLNIGDEDNVTVGNTTVRAVLGVHGWEDKKTKAPLYIALDDPLHPLDSKTLKPNPLLFGVDEQAKPTPSGPPSPKTQAEYDAIPPGTEYVDTDGKRKKKR